MGHDGWPQPFVGGATHQLNPLKPHVQSISKITVCSRKPATQHFLSGKKRQHKHTLFGPDFPRIFLTLTPGCPGVKKFLPTSGAAGKRAFWCGRPRCSARTSMTRRDLERLCPDKVSVDCLAPILRMVLTLLRIIDLLMSADRKRGQRKGATSKNVKRCQHIFDTFRLSRREKKESPNGGSQMGA